MNILSVKKIVEENGIIFLMYGGFLSQTLITGMTEALEKEVQSSELNAGVASNIFTIFIELSQNMMNYSITKYKDHGLDKSEALIVIGKDSDNFYYISSQNVVDKKGMEVINSRLDDIISLNKEEIKNRYRELRKSGKHSHNKGGGIGFYEIAKRCNGFEYEFLPIDEDRYYFQFKVIVHAK